VPGVEIAIRRSDGSLVDGEEQGELYVRTPWQMMGYWENAEASHEAAAAGAIRSGDLGVAGSDGLLYLRGRSKELISTGGENVFPSEVEAVLARHPAVAETAVYGASDPYWGERVEAAVVLRQGTSLGLEELREFARGALAGYKLPRALRIRASLPLTPMMKVSRLALRAEAEREELG
jgi:acyl-CoA synthetase (AMP-forming)/AMP-acid ligase II